MRHQDRIYIQTPHSAVRNKAINNVNTSSDFCEFFQPTFSMTGASNIISATTSGTTVILSGFTSADDFIHIIDTGTTFDLTFAFTGNVETFIDYDTTFEYNIYRYNEPTSVFTSPPIFSSGDVEWPSFSATSAFTDTLLVSEFIVDGEYLVKGSYIFSACTQYLGLLGVYIDTRLPLIGDNFGIYDVNFDNYFALINKAIKPIFKITPSDGRELGTLTVETTEITDETEITTINQWVGSPIVALNGLTLGEGDDEDYTTLGNTIYFNAALKAEDIVTVAYISNGNANGLLSESFIVTDPITSGATDGEGLNVYYYNTDTNKYEIYMLAEPIEFNDIIVTINGVTLGITVDYQQSTINPRRIILNGDIYDDDIITITYNSYGSIVGTIYVDNFDVFWSIAPAPSNANGLFTALVSDDNSFSGGTIVYSATTPYIINETSYTVNVDLSGYSGTTAFYKIVNQKDYTLITGDIISTTTDSDIIPIELNL